MRPFLLDHPGHGRGTNQCSDQEEKQRKYFGNAVYDIGIALKGVKPDVIFSRVCINLWLIQFLQVLDCLVDIFLPILQLGFRIGEFLIRLVQVLVILAVAVPNLLSALLDLLPAFLDLFTPVLDLLSAFLDLLLFIDLI